MTKQVEILLDFNLDDKEQYLYCEFSEEYGVFDDSEQLFNCELSEFCGAKR